jgi:hypothetical protein
VARNFGCANFDPNDRMSSITRGGNFFTATYATLLSSRDPFHGLRSVLSARSLSSDA